MDFQTATLDGQEILNGSTTGIYYTGKEWRQLTTDDSSVNLSGYHGRRVSATFARKRIVRMEGVILRSGNNDEEEAVKYLQNLFNLQSNTASVEDRVLYILDLYGDEWNLNVKVRDPIVFAEYDGDFKGAAWKWMVTLESTDSPIYRGLDELTETGSEGSFGGFVMPFVLPIAFDETQGVIECVTAGNAAALARFEITCTDTIASPLQIMNLTNGTFFALDVTGTAGDVFVIDSNDQTATKNGVSVKASRVAGSEFPTISGTTNFIVTDVNNGILDHMTVAIFYRDALLA